MVSNTKHCRTRLALLLAGAALPLAMISASHSAHAQSGRPLKIALVLDRTGAFEEAARQTADGFKLGLEYATQGKMAVAGRSLVLVEKDSALKADLARSRLAEAFADDNADIAVGGTGSSQALAMLPVAEEYKKVLFIEAGVADQVTGANWNRYIFRVARNATQDAMANARAIAKPGTSVATLAFDYSAGRDTIAALRNEINAIGAKLVHEEYAAADAIDFTAPGQRLYAALSKLSGDRVIWVNWFGTVNPVPQLQRMQSSARGIRLATYGNTFSYMKAFKEMPGMEGATSYYYALPKNATNDWLVAQYQKRFKGPPDLFVASAMGAAIAMVRGLEKTQGDANAEKLIPALEDLKFESPKGEMVLRKDDHQAMQVMYHFKIKVDPAVEWGVPELVREIPIAELKVPVRTPKK